MDERRHGLPTQPLGRPRIRRSVSPEASPERVLGRAGGDLRSNPWVRQELRSLGRARPRTDVASTQQLPTLEHDDDEADIVTRQLHVSALGYFAPAAPPRPAMDAHTTPAQRDPAQGPLAGSDLARPLRTASGEPPRYVPRGGRALGTRRWVTTFVVGCIGVFIGIALRAYNERPASAAPSSTAASLGAGGTSNPEAPNGASR